MQARKKKNSVTVVGKEKNSSLEGVAPVVRDYWDLSVSRLKSTATSDKVKRYLQERGIDVREVFIFESKITSIRLSIQNLIYL